MNNFDSKKAAQIAAYFLIKRGDKMSHLKLTKLLYLAEREHLSTYGCSLTNDKPVSMPHGPVLSTTLDLMDGNIDDSYWESLISSKENHELSIKPNISISHLKKLSRAEINVLDKIWEKFGKMSRWQIRDYTHIHCKEWVDPNGSSNPIKLKDLLIATGKTESQANSIESFIESQRQIDNLFAVL